MCFVLNGTMFYNGCVSRDTILPYDNDSTKGIVLPSEVAIKVFKTTLADFKNRADYVKGDFRYFKDEFKKQNPRKIMKIWAEKESINLRRYNNKISFVGRIAESLNAVLCS